MGQTTPNMGIYVPDAGETNYDASFEAGMNNIDAHDHSGGPNKGVPLSSSGIADGSITKEKLATDVVTAGEGLAIDGGNPNALIADGLLNSLYKVASNGVLCRTAAGTATPRTITGTANQVTVTNGDGVSGNPTLSLPIGTSTAWSPQVFGGGTEQDGTYNTQHGRYIRLGALVIAIGQVDWSGNAQVGDLEIRNLPVAFGAGGTSYISTCGFANITLPTGTIQVALDGNNNDTTANLYGWRDANTQQAVQLGAAGTLNFTLVYFAA